MSFAFCLTVPSAAYMVASARRASSILGKTNYVTSSPSSRCL